MNFSPHDRIRVLKNSKSLVVSKSLFAFQSIRALFWILCLLLIINQKELHFINKIWLRFIGLYCYLTSVHCLFIQPASHLRGFVDEEYLGYQFSNKMGLHPGGAGIWAFFLMFNIFIMNVFCLK